MIEDIVQPPHETPKPQTMDGMTERPTIMDNLPVRGGVDCIGYGRLGANTSGVREADWKVCCEV